MSSNETKKVEDFLASEGLSGKCEKDEEQLYDRLARDRVTTCDECGKEFNVEETSSCPRCAKRIDEDEDTMKLPEDWRNDYD